MTKETTFETAFGTETWVTAEVGYAVQKDGRWYIHDVQFHVPDTFNIEQVKNLTLRVFDLEYDGTHGEVVHRWIHKI